MISSQIAYLADLGSKFILVALFFASFLVLAFYIERKLFFGKHFHRDVSDLIGRIKKCANRVEVESILNNDNKEESKLIMRSLKDPKNDDWEKFESSVSVDIDLEKKSWEKHLLYFATVGSNAPFLGLLGTVLGLMQAFSDLALAARPDAKAAMSGISNALITTVAGIVIAIPAVVIYNSLSKKVTRISTDIKAIAKTVSRIL
jgi:biopolymer transport protein ExbB/TolQ